MQSDAPDPEQPRPNRRTVLRHRRADRSRKKALSPWRIGFSILALPLTTGMIAAALFLRVSEYDRHEATVHLIALAGCDAAWAMGLGPFRAGQAGYHPRYDTDGDGVSCVVLPAESAEPPPRTEAVRNTERAVGGAKFIRP